MHTQEFKLEKEMAIHSTTLAWRIPGLRSLAAAPEQLTHKNSSFTAKTQVHQAPCIGSTESLPLAHQGSPSLFLGKNT